MKTAAKLSLFKFVKIVKAINGALNIMKQRIIHYLNKLNNN